jgi:integrase
VFRRKGRRQEQALGLIASLKRKIIEACPEDLRGLRDRALIVTGYDTLCRRAELVELLTDDLTIKRDGSGTILVRKSKADKFSDGRLAYLSADAIAQLLRWLEAAQLTSGPIFRRVRGRHVWRSALHASAVASLIKHRAKGAGVGEVLIEHLSGHSMRVGAAQDMAAAGIDLAPSVGQIPPGMVTSNSPT